MIAAPAQDGFAARHYTAPDGLRLHFRDYGDALHGRTPVVCLPGLTRNARDFHDVALRLSADRRVLCPDYRGRGLSQRDRDWRNYAAPVVLRDLLALLSAANAPRVVVLGTSFGALLAFGLAVARPSAVAGVIINDAGPEMHGPGLGRILAYIGQNRPQPSWEAAVAAIKPIMPGHAGLSEEGWLRIAHGTYRAGDDGMLHFDWDTSLAQTLTRRGARIPNLWPLYRALRRVPALAIRGALSDVLAPDTFDRMAEAKPDLVRLVVPDVGHAPTLSEPQARDAIDAFLQPH
jgi:pimeloyl-ACP methyl ester carboxylesterase